MWDERYSAEGYAYGKNPKRIPEETDFRCIPKGRVLSLAEGEGRNAVFLAGQGYQVTAVDSSQVGLSKGKEVSRREWG